MHNQIQEAQGARRVQTLTEFQEVCILISQLKHCWVANNIFWQKEIMVDGEQKWLRVKIPLKHLALAVTLVSLSSLSLSVIHLLQERWKFPCCLPPGCSRQPCLNPTHISHTKLPVINLLLVIASSRLSDAFISSWQLAPNPDWQTSEVDLKRRRPYALLTC